MVSATIGRRAIMAGAAALWAGKALGAIPTIRQAAKARVIVDNDFAGDPDGLIALAHQLASKAARTVLITTSALDAGLAGMGGMKAGGTAEAGRAAAEALIATMGIPHPPPVVAGREDFGTGRTPASAAARAIVSEAMRDDALPLFLACGGPLTNVADALMLEPRIASRLTLVWIGGGDYPDGGSEYNLVTDLDAARHVIEKSEVPIWQVPDAAYRQLQLSVAEMDVVVRPISPLTRWLYDRYLALPPFVTLGGAIGLGDSPLVLLTSISADSSHARDVTARRLLPDGRYGTEMPGRRIRLFDRLDARLALADFIAAMRGHAAR